MHTYKTRKQIAEIFNVPEHAGERLTNKGWIAPTTSTKKPYLYDIDSITPKGHEYLQNISAKFISGIVNDRKRVATNTTNTTKEKQSNSVIKCSLRKFCRSVKLREEINLMVNDLNKMIMLGYKFANLHILRLLNDGGEIPDLGEGFFKKCMKYVSIKTLQQETSKTDIECNKTYEIYRTLVDTGIIPPDRSLRERESDTSAKIMTTVTRNHLVLRFHNKMMIYIQKRYDMSYLEARDIVDPICNGGAYDDDNAIVLYCRDLLKEQKISDSMSWEAYYKAIPGLLTIYKEILNFFTEYNNNLELEELVNKDTGSDIDNSGDNRSGRKRKKRLKLFTILPHKKHYIPSFIHIDYNRGLHGLLTRAGLIGETQETVRNNTRAYWEQYFNIKKFEGRNKEFNGMMTDGKYVSILLNIPDKTPAVELTARDVNYRNYSKIVGIDPGLKSLYQARWIEPKNIETYVNEDTPLLNNSQYNIQLLDDCYRKITDAISGKEVDITRQDNDILNKACNKYIDDENRQIRTTASESIKCSSRLPTKFANNKFEYKCSASQYYHNTKFTITQKKRNRFMNQKIEADKEYTDRKRRELLDIEYVREFEANTPPRKTSNIDVYVEHLRYILHGYDRVMNFYWMKRFRKWRFTRYIFERKTMDKMCQTISGKRIPSDPSNVLVGYGNFNNSNKSCIKGRIRTPVLGFKKHLRRWCPVIDVDEHRTSVLCQYCHQRMKNLRLAAKKSVKELANETDLVNRNINILHPVKSIHSILRCQNSKCGVVLDRDINGCNNILKMFLIDLMRYPRPRLFTRSANKIETEKYSVRSYYRQR